MRIRRSSRSLAQWVFPTEFKDKEDLFVESLRRYFDVLMARGHLTKQPLGWTNVESFLKVCYGSWGQKGCFSVNSMRELAGLPPKARQIMGRKRNESSSAAHRQSSGSAWSS